MSEQGESKDTKHSTDLLGKTIGQYELQQEIGRGGMATVYSARQISMNRTVAIKVLPRHFLHDPGFLERFEREVDVVSKLEHPHILPIYDYGETEGVPYIAMRYLGGGSMADMIRRGAPDLADMVQPLRQVGAALDYAHQRGIIHRDLKPGNIMLDEGGNAYLSDFGIARVMGSDLTGSAIIGTPAYMSPEQAHGVPIDARSDIYSLGIVLFELITGREPYRAETPMGLLLMHINEPIPAVRQFREDVPEAVQIVVERATAKDPDQRYASASELADAFAAAVRGDHVTPIPTKPSGQGVTESGVLRSVKTVPSPSASDNIETMTESKPLFADVDANASTAEQQTISSQSRSPWMWILGLLLIVIIVGGGLLFALNGGVPGLATTIVPTPFRGADTASANHYSISVPSRWQFRDESDITRLTHTWRADDDSAFVVLSFIEDGDTSVEAFNSRYVGSSAQLIDEATAEDGTLRRSYRLTDHVSLANGQIDQFFYEGEDGLTVVEMYTADSVAANNTTITTLQLILDSLRLS